MQIGGVLASGERQDGRSPDYDDWSLNGDLIVYYPVLDIALELSSMGIRVNADALRAQLKECGCQSRAKLPFQKSILNGTLPQTIGGDCCGFHFFKKQSTENRWSYVSNSKERAEWKSDTAS